ncbi:MAG: hypothetical protein ABMA26_20825, partial [Limisphaerales bacterium]
MAVFASPVFRLCFLLLTAPFLAAAEPEPARLHAWYHDAGVKADAANVTAWENSAGTNAQARSLTRVVGRPQAVHVSTATGTRTVVRFNGSAALWQAVSSWGTLAGERTVVVFARVSATNAGVFFDGSTRSGSTPVKWNGKAWQSAAKASAPTSDGGWQTHTFVFSAGGNPLGGFILGANVATQEGLPCDIAEVLVYPRSLGEADLKAVSTYLSAKWGAPTD